MSFSSETKDELCRVGLSRSCCALAEAYGVLLYCHTFDRREIRVITAGEGFAQRLPRLFRRAFGLSFDRVPAEGAGGKRTFLITDPEKLFAVSAAFGQENDFTHHINFGVLENDCCRASFLRGAFLAGGSIIDPEKRYHLEFFTAHAAVSREVYSLMLEMGLSPKDSRRGGSALTYFKQSEAIEDVLTTMGAPLAAMGVMQAKMQKDMRNAVNRRVNCDSANADKIVAASREQLEAIRELDRLYGLTTLPDTLQETAMLRIANPEASLIELSRLADPPVSKSCMSHRLKKLLSYKGE
ncbi:MAG: DNA-binding protein WhiA [Oscillospiraceae bacterium]|nr:DNA-binding protein WhiA [Oscillospiraceae bacterium]